jgi:hypothetical protein
VDDIMTTSMIIAAMCALSARMDIPLEKIE